MNRQDIIDLIYLKLVENKKNLEDQFRTSKDSIGSFFIDDLLPEDIAKRIYQTFPSTDNTNVVLHKNIREFKYVAYQMNKFDSLLEDVIYAFQDKKIVNLIGEICGKQDILPDEHLYAGGVSLMKKGHYLHPHLDNSHDKDRNRWRVFNLLYYVTPDWHIDYGGNLELWPKGITDNPITVESKFNRLVLMVTHQNSWHSVSKVEVDKVRCCVSNYYFSHSPILPSDRFHVTTFRGRPKQYLLDMVLKSDSTIRGLLRKFFKKGIRENPHQYKK